MNVVHIRHCVEPMINLVQICVFVFIHVCVCVFTSSRRTNVFLLEALSHGRLHNIAISIGKI